MVTLGYDIGTRFVKVCILKDEKIIGQSCIEIKDDLRVTLKQAESEALKMARTWKWTIKNVIATGAGSSLIKSKNSNYSIANCIAVGANSLDKEVRTIIDIGGLFINVINIDEKGKVIDFIEVEKCAAGSGKFLETIALAVEVPINTISKVALKSDNPYNLVSGCAVFAESEVISKVNQGAKQDDIIAGLMESIVIKIITMLNRTTINDKVAIIGGVAKFDAFKMILERKLEREVFYLPMDSQLIAAYGAALLPFKK